MVTSTTPFSLMPEERNSVTAAGPAACGVFGRILALGHLERMAAAARRDGVRIVDREPCRLDRVDVVDLRALQVRRAEGIDDDGDAVLLELEVALGCTAVEPESVLETGAAATLDRDAQHRAAFGGIRLLGHQLLDLHRRRLGHRKQRSGGWTLLNFHLCAHRSSVLGRSPDSDFVTLRSRFTLRFFSSFVSTTDLLGSGRPAGGSECSTTGFHSSCTEASRS